MEVAAKPAGDVRRLEVARHVLAVGLAPDGADAAAHAHGVKHLGVAAAGLGENRPLGAVPGGLLDRAPRQSVGDEGDGDEDQRADGGGDADQRVEEEADREIERHPRQIEQRARTGTGQERPDRIEVAKRLHAVGAPRLERQPGEDVIDAAGERFVERDTDARKDAAAQDVEDALEGVERGGDDGEADQRRDAPAGDHPVIDLQHEERAGEVEEVEEHRHRRRADEGAAARGQRRPEFGSGRTGLAAFL